MLHIVWLILKIAGIFLAAVLGLLLFAVLLILFVPVRYRIEADGRLGEEEPLRAKIKVTWLLHIVNVFYHYPKMTGPRIRIFFFPILRSPQKDKADRQKKREKDTKEQTGGTDSSIETVKEEDIWDKIPADKADDKNVWAEKNEAETGSETEHEMVQKNGGHKEARENFSPEEKITEEPFPEGKNSFVSKIKRYWKKLKAFCAKIWNAFINMQYTVRTICDKIKKAAADLQYYLDLLKSDVFRAAFGLCGKQLGRILKSIRPKKCHIRLLVGTGDPAGTGQILAVYGIFYPFIGNNVRIEADFDGQAVLEGSLFIKGRIRVFTLLVSAFKVYRDKNIRRLIKMFKREEA